MTRSDRLKPIVKIAESHEKEAARMLGLQQRLLDQYETKLGELLSWRKEYREQFQQAGKQGIQASKMHDYQAFLQRLDLAISQQRQMIEQAIYHYEQHKKNWQSKRSRTQALDKTVDRFKKQEQREETRKEQKELDEHAQRRFQTHEE
ncbi:MAG: flagellar export protein FliJ [Gammaproteobacteria bacterium]|nr:flagellar export protein FliJ [Gammaproteobacteria bacterium]MDH5594634.1 flagellar export protein FliJ [Gammaproteobacteria bacterium]